MAGVEPYALCPCGSGQKFKWCCQKMEPFADRAQRLYETGQIQSAIEVLDEGLKKEPANAWLLTRKALIQIREGQSKEAKDTLRQLLARRPQHIAGHALLVRAVLETEGPLEGIAQLQQALSAVSEGERKGLSSLIAVTGTLLARIGDYPSALAHIALARSMTAESAEDDRLSSIEGQILGSASVPPWLKTTYTLSPTPDGLDAESSRRFAEALGWAEAGLWSSAAAAFESLSAAVSGPEADRNAGLCRLWQADDAGAVSGLRRAVRKMGNTTEAVDLEALCQLVEPMRAADKVDLVHLIWPLRQRDALLATLRGSKEVVEEEAAPIDPTDPESPQVEWFALLDRPALPPGGADLKTGMLPKIVGRIAVGREIAALEAHDSGGLDALAARFTALAGSAIPPAHPKTKTIQQDSRSQLALSWEWSPPEGADPFVLRKLTDEEQARVFREVWPETKLPALNGQTPRQASKAGNAVVPLRAAMCQFDWREGASQLPLDTAAMRQSLGIEPEPEVDPSTVDLSTLSFARYLYVPVDRLDDDRLVEFARLARKAVLTVAMERAAHALAARPHLIESGKASALGVYSELALAAAGREQDDEAFRLIAEGRRVEPAAERAKTAPAWDLLEIRVRARVGAEPEVWVPELAIVLERYRDNPTASQVLMLNLLEMGLLRMAPNPDNPGDYLIDPRPLQMLMSEYGPRVTTASGQLGVSATKGGIWTPESERGGQPGGLWTPGSAGPQPGGPDKPKLIIPGR
jgi:hypothetical protein